MDADTASAALAAVERASCGNEHCKPRKLGEGVLRQDTNTETAE